MDKKYIWFNRLIVLVVLYLLFCIDTKVFILKTYILNSEILSNLISALNSEFWSNLISALIGAIVTIVGIYWTLAVQKKQSNIDLLNSHRPYLRYRISLGVYPYRIIDQRQRTAVLDYEISNSNSSDEQFVIFPLDVENVGLGLAFITDVKAEIDGKTLDKDKEFREKIINKGENSVFYIKVLGVSYGELKKLKLKITYKSFFEEFTTETISIAKREDDEPQCFNRKFEKGSDSYKELEKFFEKKDITDDDDKKIYRKTTEETLKRGYIVKELIKEKQYDRTLFSP